MAKRPFGPAKSYETSSRAAHLRDAMGDTRTIRARAAAGASLDKLTEAERARFERIADDARTLFQLLEAAAKEEGVR